MNWEEATIEQIHEIIFNDEECELEFKWQAVHELIKRNNQFNVFFKKIEQVINTSLDAQKQLISDSI